MIPAGCGCNSVKARLITLRKIHGKVNPADLLTKPKSAAEAGRLADSLGFRLVMRKRKEGETFTGMVRRWMRGDKGSEGEKAETLEWWIDRYGGGCDQGGGGSRGERAKYGGELYLN